VARSEEDKKTQKEIVQKYFANSLVKDLFLFSWEGPKVKIECTKKACDMFEELKRECGVTEEDINGYLKQVTAKIILNNVEQDYAF
jgi:hypothetical protein